MTVPTETKAAANPRQLRLIDSQLARTQRFLSSKLSSSPLIRVTLRPLSFCLSLASPVAAAIDGRIEQLVHLCAPSHLHASVLSAHPHDTLVLTDKADFDLQPGLPPVSLPFALPQTQPPQSSQSQSDNAAAERLLVGAVWERHMKDELTLSNITPEQCLQAFYNASCHCFLAHSSSNSATATAATQPHSSRSALTFVGRLRSSLRTAWHPDLLPVALSFYQLASRHLQHHSLLFPPPSPFPFFLSDSFRDHYFALHASSIRAVYEQQLSAVCPAVYHSLERIYDSPAPATLLHALHEHLSASPSLSPLLPHISHALHRIHHQQMADSLADVEPSTALVLSTHNPTGHLTLSAAMWSTVDTALIRWRQAVQRGCLALHECVRVMEEESARRELKHGDDCCLELEQDDVLLLAHDDSDDDDDDKQLVPLLHTASVASPISPLTSSANSPTSLSRQLQRQILTSLKQLTAAPLSSPRTSSASPPSPALSPSSPALHYHLSHLYHCLASLHSHLLHYLLSSSLLHYPRDLLSMARDSALCVLGGEAERLGELEYGGLVGKVYEVVRAFSETVQAMQSAG